MGSGEHCCSLQLIVWRVVGGLMRDWPELEGLDKIHLQLEQLGQEIRKEVKNIYNTENSAQCTLCEHFAHYTLHCTPHCTLHTAH